MENQSNQGSPSKGQPEKYTRLLQDIQTNDAFTFIDHLDGYFNLDTVGENGYSLLHECVNYCNYPALIELISRGANVNVQNERNLTPLHIAIWKGYLHLAAPLLKAGANADAADIDGRVPLYFAVERGDVRSMRLLIDFHADPNVVVGKKSLLAIASRKGYAESIKILLDAGAIFNRGTSHPLIEVLVSGNREAFGILIHGREHEIPYLHLPYENEKNVPYIIIAIKVKTMLLPLIAALVKQYTEEAKESGDNAVTPFPPPNITGPEKRRLQKALEVHDSMVPIDYVNDKVKRLKSPWSARGIDEFECLEPSYAGGDTVAGARIQNGGELGNYNPSMYGDLKSLNPNSVWDGVSTQHQLFADDDANNAPSKQNQK